MKLLWRSLALFSLVLASGTFVPQLFAQDITQLIGNPPGTDQLSIPFGFVNIGTGDLHLSIPLSGAPQRGVPTSSIAAVYDSSIWATVNDGQANFVTMYEVAASTIGSGWNLVDNGDPITSLVAVSPKTLACPTGYSGSVTNYMLFTYTDGNGASHLFVVTGSTSGISITNCNNTQTGAPEPNQKTLTVSAYAYDNSGYYLTAISTPGATNLALTLIGPDGTNLGAGGGYGSATIGETPNGNSIRDLGPSAPVFSASGCISTSTGKPVRPFPGETGSPYVATSSYVCTLSIPAWDPVAQKTVTKSYTFDYSNEPVCTNFQYVNPTPSEVYDYCGGIEVLTNIGLPDGTFYSFEYDTDSTAGHYGRMTSMTLPTGGTVFMGYQPVKAGTLAEANGQVTSVTRGTAETQLAYTFPWSPSTGYYYPVTVTYPSHVTNPATGATVQDHTVYSLAAGGTTASTITETVKEYSGSSLLLRTTTEDKTTPGYPSFFTTTWNQTGASHTVNYKYGTGLVVTQKQEYVNGALLRTVNTQYQADTSSIKYQSQYNMWTLPSQVQALDSGNNVVAQTNYTYDEYSAGYCTTSYPTSLSGIAMLTAVSGALGHDDTRGTSYLARGNATTITRSASSSATISTHNCYDTLGNVTQTVDGRGNATRYSYVDNFVDTSCVASTTPTYGFATLVTDSLGHQTKASYTSCLRMPYATQNANDIAASRTGTIQTYDIEGRPLCTTYPDGGQSCNSYPTATTIVSTQLVKSGTTHQVNTYLDDFGNPTRTQDQDALQSTTEVSSLGSTEGVGTTKTYDGTGRLNSVSFPAFGDSSNTSLSMQYAYDALGRVTGKWLTTTTTNGTSAPTVTYGTPYTWTYSGPNVDTYDESGLHHTLSYDALGRLTKVLEPAPTTNVPTLETDYTYDAMNNLQKVNQLGASGSTARVRTFTYDFLSRLVCASNPENSTTACPTSVATAIPSGVMSYGYDANGNLVSKTDARGITVVPAYDALNRLKSETATGINYAYAYDVATADGVAASNPIGQLVWATNNVNADVHYSYDSMGRVVKQTGSSPQNTAETANPVSAVYDLAGNMTLLTYPDGRTVTQPRDAAGRVTSVNYASWGATAVNSPYLTVSTFNPNGQVATSKLGNGITASMALNGQLEIASVQYASSSATLWSKALTWSPSGNLQLSTDNVKGTARQFSYDDLNRLTLAQDVVPSTKALVANGLNESYSYDSFGNIQQAGNFNFDQTYTAANRLSGYSYDAAGNLLSDGLTNTMQYDSNGRVTTDSGTKYYYDPIGNRVGKAGSTATDIVYFNGQPIARLSAGAWTDLVYGPAGLLAEVPGTQTGVPTYRITDHLGSLAGILSSTGTVVSLLDHAPFGQVFAGSTSDPYQFTSYERDPESGFDYAGARYYASSMGSFMSPDPSGLLYANPFNPQSLNLYSYAQNNPLTNIDPTGKDCVYLSNNSSSIEEVDADSDTSASDCGSTGGTHVTGSLTGYGSTDPDGTINEFYSNAYGTQNGSQNGMPNPSTVSGFFGYLGSFLTGSGPTNVLYGPGNTATQQMQNTQNVQKVTDQYLQAGCPGTPSNPAALAQGHASAYLDSAQNPSNGTQLEVGGYSGGVYTANGMTTFTINNPSSMSSLDGESAVNGSHSTDNPRGPTGAGHTVNQTFQWTEAGLCGH